MRRLRRDQDSLPSTDEEDVDVDVEELEEGEDVGDDVDMEEEVEDEEVDGEGEGVEGEDEGTLCLTGSPTLSHDPRVVREIGHEAVWSLSTAKPGNGVEQIRDSSVDTYWQSDGGQPHLINIQFSKRASVSMVAFYLDYNLDESYTPKRMSVRVGTTFHDLVEIRVVELNEPVGWVSVPLQAAPDPLDPQLDDDGGSSSSSRLPEANPVRAHFVQICIVSMHQNGRDTHVRQVKIFGPRNDAIRRTKIVFPEFQTTDMSQFSTVR